MNLSENIEERARNATRANKQLIVRLKKMRDNDVDILFHEEHEKTFSTINCLDCGNCCRSLGPRITDKDIDRLSKALRLSPGRFTGLNLKVDEDNDYVFKSECCPFLGDDNYCAVYDSRPKACREYPHTDRYRIKPILNLCLKNTSTCPAVLEIMETIRAELKI